MSVHCTINISVTFLLSVEKLKNCIATGKNYVKDALLLKLNLTTI